MKEQSIFLKLPDGAPYFICGDCGDISTNPAAIVKTDKLEHREKDWVHEVTDDILEHIESLTTSDWEERCDTELPDYTKDTDSSDGSDEEEETDTSTGSGLDSFMS